ncbi:MAG: Ig-like domain-containing protein, partial [Thermomicrobiales bacterium]
TIGLDWTSVGPSVEYVTEIQGGPSGTGSSFGPQGASSQDLGTLPAGYVYTWRVKARGPGGESPWSETRDFTVRLAKPSGVQAEALSCSEVSLDWQDNSESEDGYRIELGGALAASAGPNETRVVIHDLNGGSNHAFSVRAYRGDQDSAASDPVILGTPPCDVTAPHASWVEPADGATLRQATVLLDAAASDDGGGVARVEMRARWDESWHDLATLTGPPYRADWDLCAASVPDGPVDLRLRVVDNAGVEAVATITVTKRVNCTPNQPPAQPRIDTPPDDAQVAGPLPIEVIASDSYDTPEELRVEVRIDDGPWSATAFDRKTGRYAATWNSAQSADGVHALRARATDSGGLDAASDRVDVIVDNIDQQPIADAGADQSLTDADDDGAEPFTLDASASTLDPQRTASYAWELRGHGGPARSLGSGVQRPVDLTVGVNVITLTVTDSRGNHDQDDVVLTLLPPPESTPSLALSPQVAVRGEAIAVTATGYAPGETVTFTWVQEEHPRAESKHKKTHKKGKKGKKGQRGKRGKGRRLIAQPVTLGSATAASGDVSLSFTVPDEATPGKHRVLGVGSRGNRATVTLEVITGAPRLDAAGMGNTASNPGAPTPSAPADDRDIQALLPAEGTPMANGPPKRKPEKSRERSRRDDHGKNKSKRARAHVGKRCSEQDQRRHSR